MGSLFKFISMQCSWIKRLYNNSSHPCKIIPSYLIDTYPGKNVKFHSNLDIPANKIFFPYMMNKYKNLFSFPNLFLAVASHVIWNNK